MSKPTIDNQNYLDLNEIKKILRPFINELNFAEPEVIIKSGSVKGDGYMGIINAIDIIDKNNKKKSLNLIVKDALKSSNVRKEMPIRPAFLREIQVYERIYPAMKKFYETNVKRTTKLNDEKTYEFVKLPKLYETNEDERNERLIMQNIKDIGYTMCNRLKPFNDEHIRFTLDNYAKLHSVSYVMKRKEPELYEKITENVFDLFKDETKKGSELFDKLMDDIIVNMRGKLDNDVLERLEQFRKNSSNIFEEILNETEYLVLIHGDCWCNNFMYKYDDLLNPNTPTDMYFIDFQLAKLAPPQVDLAYFLGCCGNENVLNNLTKFLDYYYERLSNYCELLGCDIEELYPRVKFEKQCRKYLRFALSMASFNLKVTLNPDAQTLEEMAGDRDNVLDAFFITEQLSSKNEYMTRMHRLIDALYKNCML